MEYEYLDEALSYYNLASLEVQLLRHNENMTFRVGSEYLLQIHEHINGFHTDFIYEGLDRMEIYDTEILFLNHLQKQGMIVREIIKNRYGECITKLSNGTLATVSKWIIGESLDNCELTDEHCINIGELTARLHRAAKGFRPQNIVTYDEQHCGHIKEKLHFLEGIGLSSEYSEIMERACDAVEILLRKVQNEFLVIHADLSPSNILVASDKLVAIDFSLLGLGHPMLDLANLFANISGLVRRQKIAEGYINAGGVFNYKALDACFVLTIIDSIIIHYEKWSKQDWFKTRMERWCKEHFEPFVRGERLFADDLYLLQIGR